MSTKKVLFILNHPDEAINFFDDLLEQISEKHEMHILSIKDEETEVLKAKGYHLHFFNLVVTNPLTLICMLISIYSVIKKIRPNLVVGSTIRNTIFGNLVSHYLRVPTISPIVGIGPLFESKAKSYRLAKFLYPIALKNTHHTFFFNEDDMKMFVKNNFLSSNSYSRIRGRGVNLDKFQPITSKKNDNFTFLMVARLLYDKGIREYIEAAKIVRSNYPGVNFQIIGGFWKKNLKQNTVSEEEMTSWVNEGNIEYLGKIKDIRPFVSKSDCMILPSYREGLSNVLMEGASMGKPLLASSVPGCKELVIDGVNGFTFEARSTSALTTAILKLLSLDRHKINIMGQKSRELMVEKYDRKKSSLIFLNKIDEVLSYTIE